MGVHSAGGHGGGCGVRVSFNPVVAGRGVAQGGMHGHVVRGAGSMRGLESHAVVRAVVVRVVHDLLLVLHGDGGPGSSFV
jgi:hypothetical protein